MAAYLTHLSHFVIRIQSTMGTTTILVLLCALIGHGLVVSGQDDNTQNRIPESLLECYNSFLHNRDNLLPMTMHSLINIIRKVENSQTGHNMNLRTMVSALLYRFRLDGIERDPNVPISEGVLPYAVQGKPFYKHRIILKTLIPQNTILFPNETLTGMERCTLHFMLSSTIDRWERGDESQVCTILSNQEVKGGIRRRRQIEDPNPFKESVSSEGETIEEKSVDEESVEDKQVEDKEADNKEVDNKEVDDKETDDVAKEVQGIQNVPEELLISNDTQTSQQDVLADTDAEVVNSNASSTSGKSGAMFLDDNELYRPGVREETDKPIGRLTQADNGPAVAVSSCPQESGVVYTEWGTVSAGTVIAGLAAGTQQQTVAIRDLVKGAKLNTQLVQDVENTSPTVNNLYAVTIAGDLAEVTLHQGPKKITRVGAKGGWNDTAIPRHYFLKESAEENFLMTDAEILGGIDGFIMAHQINDWMQKNNDLKLSEVLDHYYSEKGMFVEKYRACERKLAYSEINNRVELEKQTLAFSTVLDAQSVTAATVTFAKIDEFSKTAVDVFISYQKDLLLETLECSPALVDAQVDMYVVIDKSWPYEPMRNMLLRLMEKINVSPGGSNITVLDGKKNEAFVVSCNSQTEFNIQFTEEMYNNHESGMQLSNVLEGELKMTFTSMLDKDKQLNLSTGKPIVVLFILSEKSPITSLDLQASNLSFQTYRKFLPDVKMLYLVSDNKEIYTNLVDNPEKDVFSVAPGIDNLQATIEPVAKAINQVTRRLLNPVCGSTFEAESSANLEVTETVIVRGTNMYRLHPNYFYDSAEGMVKVQGKGVGTLKVCYSRDNVSGIASNTTCQTITSEVVSIPLKNPCEGYETVLECPPLYLSIHSTGEPLSYLCKDVLLCSSVTDVMYTISQEGLICTSGIDRVVASFGLVGLTVTLLLAIKATFS